MHASFAVAETAATRLSSQFLLSLRRGQVRFSCVAFTASAAKRRLKCRGLIDSQTEINDPFVFFFLLRDNSIAVPLVSLQ